MPKVSAEHKAAVRQGLIEAAARVMLRPEPMSTRAVLTEAGVSAGTLYNYFGSLGELLESAGEWLLANEWRQFSLEIDTAAPYGGLLDVVDEFVLDEPSASSGTLPQLRGRIDLDEEARAAVGRYNEFLVELLSPAVRAGAEAGHIRPEIDAAALVELLDLVRDALIVRDAQQTYATSFDRVSSTLRSILLDGALQEPRAEERP